MCDNIPAVSNHDLIEPIDTTPLATEFNNSKVAVKPTTSIDSTIILAFLSINAASRFIETPQSSIMCAPLSR